MGPEEFMSQQAQWFKTVGTLAAIWGFAVTIFWMICGWRAMLAHERIAESLSRVVDVKANGAAKTPGAN